MALARGGGVGRGPGGHVVVEPTVIDELLLRDGVLAPASILVPVGTAVHTSTSGGASGAAAAAKKDSKDAKKDDANDDKGAADAGGDGAGDDGAKAETTQTSATSSASQANNPHAQHAYGNQKHTCDPLNFPLVSSLRLSYRNILEISDLSGFHSLEKLKLDNNIICSTKGLAHLAPSLKWLDLSFNNITQVGSRILRYFSRISLDPRLTSKPCKHHEHRTLRTAAPTAT